MKKALRLCGGVAALLALVLALSGCTAVFDRIFASGDYKRASASEDVGFVLLVPRTWICAESVVADGNGGFTYFVTATLSNSGSDKSNISAVSLPTDKSPDEFFATLYNAGKDQFVLVGNATSNVYYLDGAEGRQYEYNVTKKTGETTEVYRLMQLLVPKDGRMLVFTYTARYAPDDADNAEKDSSFYNTNWRDTVSKVLSELTFAPFRAPDVIPGEGMVEISDGTTQKFHVSVPAGWVKGFTSASDCCKAVSPDGTLTVSAMAFLPQLSGDISIAAYWEEAALPELRGMFGESFLVSEEGVTADFAGTKGARYAFRGDVGGTTYYFLQYYLLVGNSLTPNIYLLSFTSTHPIDPENETIAAITQSYGF